MARAVRRPDAETTQTLGTGDRSAVVSRFGHRQTQTLGPGSTRMQTLPTGIPTLDRRFGGGLPSGSVVALTADPASQSELVLNRLARVRACRYLTTVRSAAAVETAMGRGDERSDTAASADGGAETTVETAVGDSPDDVAAAAADLPERGTFVVDSVDPLEAAAAAPAYAASLDELRAHVVEADGIALLHALRGGEDARCRRVTEQVADVVFDLRTTVRGAEIVNRLVVPKFRGGAALEEPLKLKLTDAVSVDTSRDIA